MCEEIWKSIQGYEGLYEVSNLGNVRSLDKVVKYKWRGKDIESRRAGRLLRFWNNSGKYPYYIVGLNKDGKSSDFLVHRLVASAFIPNPYNYPVVNHIDCNCLNNKVDNLEWCTQGDNIRWGYICGNRSEAMAKQVEAVGIKVYCPELDKEFESISEAQRQLNLGSDYIKRSIETKGRRPKRALLRSYTIIKIEDKEDYFNYLESENNSKRPLFQYKRNVLELKTGKIYTHFDDLYTDYNIPRGNAPSGFLNKFDGFLPRYDCYLVDIGYRNVSPFSAQQIQSMMAQMRCQFVRKVAKSVVLCTTNGEIYRTTEEADKFFGLVHGCVSQCLWSGNGKGTYVTKNLSFVRIPISQLTDEQCLQLADGYIEAFLSHCAYLEKGN